jgi:hypothetical protein
MEVLTTRKNALRFLVRKEGGNGALAEKLKLKNGSSLSQITSQSTTRTISEKGARKYEKLLGLPHLWMDNFNEFSNTPTIDVSKRIKRICVHLNSASEDQLIAIEYALYLDLI